jgi:alpha-L-arabinofuranosidase
MKRTLLSSALLMCTLGLSAQTEPIRIDLNQRGAFVSSNLFGIFFEEISHAGDGGLYAELVQNRGFEEHVLPSSMTLDGNRAVAVDSPNYEHKNHRKWSVPWNVEQKKMQGWKVEGQGCQVAHEVLAPAVPLHPNTPHAMQLRISDVQEGGCAILTNTGYWGMGLKAGDRYDLRLYVQSKDFKGTLTARLSDEQGRDLGSVSFKAKKWKQWTELTAVLTSTATTGQGQLRLEFGGQGTVLIDYVSLFPQNTFKGRKNGQRPDIAQMLVDLHPRFMRWPGGCIVEGATYENRVKWKETLGDPMTRRGEWDTWGYRSTWGMGYHEFLQFCEDLGMDAMFVNNAGMSCSVRNGDYIADTTQLEPVVQDFRDAIDYALADPATNKWAKMRADAGHPAPFPLRYVEIGNENVGPEYVKHFNYIFRRLKAEYPRITFINTLGHTDPLLDQMPGRYMVDPHWYRDPNFFFNNNHLFDDAPRTHDIYVGEYACNAGVGQGNLLAALSEAAFILGMERNSDVVKMSSYAPLFENVNQPNWTCNLIHFDSDQVFGRASYYVQKMSAENRATYNVGVSETTTSGEPAPFTAGTVGLGTYATQSTYRNITLTTADGKSRQLSPADFRQLRGTWKVEADQLTQTSDEQHTMALLPDFKSDSYTLALQAKKLDGREGFFLYYGMDAEGRNGYTANIAGWNNSQTVVQLMRRGRSTDILSRRNRHQVEADRWYDLRLEVTPMLVTLYVDGEKVAEAKPATPTRLFCQAGYDDQKGEIVIKVVNGTEQNYKRSFSLSGAKEIQSQATAITLSGKAEEENSFDDPKRIAPVESYFTVSDSLFSYDFAPMSYTILRIKAKSPHQRRRGFGFDTKHPDVHDPVMAKGEDGRYYLFMTGMGVGVISSADLKEWKPEPGVLNPIPQWAREAVRGYGGHTWAPDISYHNGQWYLYYSCSTFGKNGSAIGLATNKTLDPTSPQFGWKDQGMVIRSQRGKDDFNAIDPNLVVDDKGNPWLTFGSFWDGIQLVKLSKKDFKTPKGKPVTISRRVGRRLTHAELNDVASWTVENGRDTIEAGPNAVEAPFILRHGDYYYLFVSFDFCCRGERSTYKTVYGRSKNVEGPYLDKKGQDMAHGGGTLLYGPNQDYFGVGHNAAYDMDGKTWFLAHAYEKAQNGRAKLFLRPMTFDAEGWIVTE